MLNKLLGIAMKNIFIILVTFVIFGCDVNIGGAGFDDANIKSELDSYPNFISDNLSETTLENCGEKPTQQFEKMFDDFPFSIQVVENTSKTFYKNFSASFINRVLVIQNENSKTIVTETLPSAFYMHPVSLGVAELGGHTVIMVSDKSRATTGRYFIAIYLENGEAIYKKILTSGDVWDISIIENSIHILGSCNTKIIKWANT